MNIETRLKETIREVPNFPKEGISFKDITPVLEDPQLSDDLVIEMIKRISTTKIDAVVGVESRGFLYGMLLANKLEVPFITVRKKGKLPYKTVSHKYNLEYGSAEIEMHVDSLQKGWNVLIHDDLLATGGTAAATAELVTTQACTVSGFAFIVELEFLDGAKTLSPYSNNIIKLATF